MKIYDAIIQNFARSRAGGWMFVNVFNTVDRFLMSKTKARISTGIGTRFNKNAVLLGCTGARSGLKRLVPLLTTPVGSEFVLIASKAGAPEHPAWYGNLRANPDCTLTVGGRVLRCTAREAEGEERERLWRAIVAQEARYVETRATTPF